MLWFKRSCRKGETLRLTLVHKKLHPEILCSIPKSWSKLSTRALSDDLSQTLNDGVDHVVPFNPVSAGEFAAEL
jgi:hypothetical protein